MYKRVRKNRKTSFIILPYIFGQNLSGLSYVCPVFVRSAVRDKKSGLFYHKRGSGDRGAVTKKRFLYSDTFSAIHSYSYSLYILTMGFSRLSEEVCGT
nr:MAG TPA: hypothetical protein [Caudoviricetes sp.]